VIDPLDNFRDLAWQALENPADAFLRAQIETALAKNPGWVDEWQELRDAHRLANEVVPAVISRADADRTAAIPPERLAALIQTASEQRRATPSPRWRWLGFAAAIALIASSAMWWKHPPVDPSADFNLTPWLATASPGLTRALTAPLEAVVASAQLPTLRADVPLNLRSPLLATHAGEVAIAWTGEATVTLTLLESGKPIWTAAKAHSPAQTPPLPADHTYELVIAPDSGRALRERFVTVASTDAPETGFGSVLAAITREPARLGDAVLAWQALPESLRRSETGVRLGLWLAVEARQPEMLAEAKSFVR
jgi:hypothetical protein